MFRGVNKGVLANCASAGASPRRESESQAAEATWAVWKTRPSRLVRGEVHENQPQESDRHGVRSHRGRRAGEFKLHCATRSSSRAPRRTSKTDARVAPIQN